MKLSIVTLTRSWVILWALLCAGSASAVPITWSLQGVRFSDGGAASGSFVYDATVNLYSSINIVTTTGSVRTGAIYLFVNPNAFISTAINLAAVTKNSGDLTGTPWFDSLFLAPLTNAGGTVGIDTMHGGGEASCAPPNCIGTTEPNRSFAAGAVTSAPEPSTILLFALGLGVLPSLAAPAPPIHGELRGFRQAPHGSTTASPRNIARPWKICSAPARASRPDSPMPSWRRSPARQRSDSRGAACSLIVVITSKSRDTSPAAGCGSPRRQCARRTRSAPSQSHLRKSGPGQPRFLSDR